MGDYTEKILTWGEVAKQANAWRTNGRKIVFTNGCFDILHAGHVRYLYQASLLGQELVIGLNDDKSVACLKGASRPVNPQNERAEILAALRFVSAVVIFDEETPLELIQLIKPDILVKGGDWPVESIVGREIVQERGGLVLSIPLVAGLSTTNIIERIQAR